MNPAPLIQPPTSQAAPQNIQQEDFFDRLPQEMILKVLSYLTCFDLARCSGVSRSWKTLTDDSTLWKAFDLEELFPSLKIFDSRCWRSYFHLPAYNLSVEGEPPLDKGKMIPILKKSFSSVPVQKNAGFTLLTIPQNLDLNFLKNIAQGPKNNQPISIEGPSVKATYRILITRNVLDLTKGGSAMVNKEFLQNNGWKIPNTIEAAAFFVTALISSDPALDNNPQDLATYCSDEPNGIRYMVGSRNTDLALYTHHHQGDISFNAPLSVLGLLRFEQMLDQIN